MKIKNKIERIKFQSIKLFRFTKYMCNGKGTVNKITKTLISLLFLIIALNILVFILSPNNGWVSLDSDLIYTLNVEAGYLSAENKSYMLEITPFKDAHISINFMADEYQLYDKCENIVKQSKERHVLSFDLSDNEGLIISSASNNSELIEYDIFAQLNVSFLQKRDTVFVNDGFQEKLKFTPHNGGITIQTRNDTLVNQWKIQFTNSKEYSSLYCTGYIFLQIDNCSSIIIGRNGLHTVSSITEYWYLSDITECSASLVGSINFKVASMSMNYQVANQPLFIKGNDLTSILRIDDGNLTSLKLTGAANVVKLNRDSLFPSVFNIIYSNLWGFLAILITPFISYVLNIWNSTKKK